MDLPDSGQREEFNTGSVRDTQEDKPRYDLIPPEALKRVAMHFTRGARKYAERNWEKGQPVSRLLASMMRHVEAFRLGDVTEDHLAAVAWNAMAIMTFEDRGRTDLLDAGSSIMVAEMVHAKHARMRLIEDEVKEILTDVDEYGSFAFTTHEFMVILADQSPLLMRDVTFEELDALLYNNSDFSLDANNRWVLTQ